MGWVVKFILKAWRSFYFNHLSSYLALIILSPTNPPQSPRCKRSSSHSLVKLWSFRFTAHLHFLVPLFSWLWNCLPATIQSHSSLQGFKQRCAPLTQVIPNPYMQTFPPTLTLPNRTQLSYLQVNTFPLFFSPCSFISLLNASKCGPTISLLPFLPSCTETKKKLPRYWTNTRCTPWTLQTIGMSYHLLP